MRFIIVLYCATTVTSIEQDLSKQEEVITVTPPPASTASTALVADVSSRQIHLRERGTTTAAPPEDTSASASAWWSSSASRPSESRGITEESHEGKSEEKEDAAAGMGEHKNQPYSPKPGSSEEVVVPWWGSERTEKKEEANAEVKTKRAEKRKKRLREGRGKKQKRDKNKKKKKKKGQKEDKPAGDQVDEAEDEDLHHEVSCLFGGTAASLAFCPSSLFEHGVKDKTPIAWWLRGKLPAAETEPGEPKIDPGALVVYEDEIKESVVYIDSRQIMASSVFPLPIEESAAFRRRRPGVHAFKFSDPLDIFSFRSGFCEISEAPTPIDLDTHCPYWDCLWKCDSYETKRVSQIWRHLADPVSDTLFGVPPSESEFSGMIGSSTSGTNSDCWTSDVEAKGFTIQRKKKPKIREQERFNLGEPYDHSIFKEKTDFASSISGSRITIASKNLKSAKNLLSTDDSTYALAPCNGRPWFVTSLSDEIKIQKIGFLSLEYFASTFRYWQILGSNTYPTEKWRLISEVETNPYVLHEIFTVNGTCSREKIGCWVKYVKVRALGYHKIDDYHYCALTRFQIFGGTVMEQLSTDVLDFYPEEDDVKDQNLKSPTVNDMIDGVETLLKGAFNDPLEEAANSMDPLNAVLNVPTPDYTDTLNSYKNVIYNATDANNRTVASSLISNATEEEGGSASSSASSSSSSSVILPDVDEASRSSGSSTSSESNCKNGGSDVKKGGSDVPWPLDNMAKWSPDEMWGAQSKWSWLLPVTADMNSTDPGMLLRLLVHEFESKGVGDGGSDWFKTVWGDEPVPVTNRSSVVPPLVRLGDHLRTLETHHLRLHNTSLKMQWLIGRQEGATHLLSTIIVPMYETLNSLVQRINNLHQNWQTQTESSFQETTTPTCTPEQYWLGSCTSGADSSFSAPCRPEQYIRGTCRVRSKPLKPPKRPREREKPYDPEAERSLEEEERRRKQGHWNEVPIIIKKDEMPWERFLLFFLLLVQLYQWLEVCKSKRDVKTIVLEMNRMQIAVLAKKKMSLSTAPNRTIKESPSSRHSGYSPASPSHGSPASSNNPHSMNLPCSSQKPQQLGPSPRGSLVRPGQTVAGPSERPSGVPVSVPLAGSTRPCDTESHVLCSTGQSSSDMVTAENALSITTNFSPFMAMAPNNPNGAGAADAYNELRSLESLDSRESRTTTVEAEHGTQEGLSSPSYRSLGSQGCPTPKNFLSPKAVSTFYSETGELAGARSVLTSGVGGLFNAGAGAGGERRIIKDGAVDELSLIRPQAGFPWDAGAVSAQNTVTGALGKQIVPELDFYRQRKGLKQGFNRHVRQKEQIDQLSTHLDDSFFNEDDDQLTQDASSVQPSPSASPQNRTLAPKHHPVPLEKLDLKCVIENRKDAHN